MIEYDRPLIRGEKVWLRAFEQEDLEAHWLAVNDGDVAHFTGYRAPQSMRDVQNWYETRVHGSEKQKYFFVISPIGSAEFLGVVMLFGFESRLGGPELGIFVSDKARWGQGLGTDAVNAMLDFAFGSLDINRIWVTTSAQNKRSQRAAQNAGFSVEGTIREHILQHGHFQDSLLMSILRSDWEALVRPRSWDYPLDE